MTPGGAGVRWHAIHVGGDGPNAMVNGPSVHSVLGEGKSASTRKCRVFHLLRERYGDAKAWCSFLTLSRLRAELSRLWDQLDHIAAIVQGRISHKFHFPNIRQSSPVTAGETPLGFPCMVLQNGAFMKLLGLDPSLARYFEHTERGRQTVPAQPLQDGILTINLDEASMYVSRALLSFYILVAQNLTRFS